MSIFLKSKNRIYYFNSAEKNAAFELGSSLSELLREHVLLNKTIIFLCIGSDRATGDCLGPIIGYKLSKYQRYQNFYVYGTLEEPVHAKNLKDTIAMIYQTHDDAFIIAIDASLGKSSHIGYITLGEGSLKPGAGVDKDLPAVGDIFITGIVNFSGMLDNMLLQTTRLNVVMSMADQICLAIKLSINKLRDVSLQ
ncbi:spore protease YyaC [Lachnospiraceae bacterium MD1]|uniref:Spore protease YyaC n=1 Tax=Variimorphobacter saccharofermentans TaxID=2755051 RepID=A0A839K4S0_9FIRM|nr:spore protease YyaC [Variimorphobacter saccharofermentans]MBB2184600.1 spore protease YyaC [Variimorphobacter saccharofermentans]